MRWGGNRHAEKWTFRSVEWPSMAEGKDVWQITGGSANLGAFTDLKATGTVDFKGTEPMERGNLVRVYYGFTDDDGESTERVVMTGFVQFGSTEHRGALKSGTAELRGVLCVLADDKPGRPYVVSAGTNAVGKAKQVAEERGLRVNATPSSYTLANEHVFDTDTSYLGIVNWLLDAAGYSGAFPDAMGTVQMVPYIEPTRREPTWRFADDGASAMKPTISDSDNSADTPNVARAWYEDDTCGLFAEATNIDPRNEASVAVLGRVNPIFVDVTELAGADATAKLANLKALVKKTLLDNSTHIRYVEVPCLYVPVEVNDCIEVEYARAGVSFLGGVTAIDVDFTRGAPCVVKARHLLKPDFETSVDGEVAWDV